MLGAQTSPCLEEGEYQLFVSYRQFKADTQYRDGSGYSEPVTSLGTQVISKMKFMELGAIYAWNERLNLTLGIPYILKGSSNRALPSSVAGSPRFTHTTTGIGDVQVGGRYWLFDCDDSPDQNVSFGLSLKMPTGSSRKQDLFPNGAGTDIRLRDVDQSIQPGDDGWGFSISLEAYKALGNFTLFGSGSYLFNPKGHNNTFSAPAFLNPVAPNRVPEEIRYNSVADSYIARAGVGYPFSALPGLSVTLAMRIDGSRSDDVFGDTTGFRRPGYFVTIEPGLNYSTNRAIFALAFPTRIHQYVEDSLGSPRDSTFADYLVEFNVSYRFGD